MAEQVYFEDVNVCASNQPLGTVLSADNHAGLIVRYWTDERGAKHPDGTGKLRTETLRGRVRFVPRAVTREERAAFAKHSGVA